MSYLVLARKWRPQSFADLVGQEHVSRTLANAIAQGRVAHAFLFTGVRGVGKTTSARILAKALNCIHGPTATPCLVCDPCREIALGTDIDVQEIDGASHTGVDDVRRIQEGLPYRPARDRFKVLIVDEVHMLSSNAWNAFLKTLEEPPPHVKFIFATTEVHKVPVTILSRCQRFDFKLISAQQIASRVRHILDVEKVPGDDAAVQLVAREAAGSMRDALSLLDQVIAFGGESLIGDEVAKVLGVADRQALHALASAIVEGRPADALLEIERLASGGFDLGHVARDLLRRFRDLVVARVVPEPGGLLDLADAELADVLSLAKEHEADDLTRLFQGMSRALDDIARGANPRHSFDVVVVRLARRPPLIPVEALLERLAELEKRLPSPPSGPGSAGGPMRGRGGPTATRPGSVTASPVQPGPPMDIASTTIPGGALVSPVRASSSEASKSAATDHPSDVAPGSIQRATAVAPIVEVASRDTERGRIVLAREAPLSAQAQVLAVATVSAQPDALLTGENLPRLERICGRLRAQRPTWGSLLEHGVILRCDEQGFEVAYEKRSFLAAQVSDRVVADAFGRAVAVELGTATRIFVSEAPPRGLSLAMLASRTKNAALETARKNAVAHQAVLDVLAILDGEVRSVRIPGDDSGH